MTRLRALLPLLSLIVVPLVACSTGEVGGLEGEDAVADDTKLASVEDTSSTDGTVTPLDSSTPPVDSGVAIDSGTAIDTTVPDTSVVDSGSTPDTSKPPTDTGPPPTCGPLTTHMGGLTQYDKTLLGNCGVPWPSDDLYAAMSTADYDSPAIAAPCGKCVEITGPTGLKAIVHAVDQCPVSSNPKCVLGHIDLSHTAYAAVVPKTYKYGGEVPNTEPIAWHYVPCAVTGPIVYHFKDGVNPYWIAVQVRNARYGIKSIQYRSGSAWVDMAPRTDALAYFLVTGLGATKIDLRAIDEYGHVLEDDGITIKADSDVAGAMQFPVCP